MSINYRDLVNKFQCGWINQEDWCVEIKELKTAVESGVITRVEVQQNQIALRG